MSDQIPRIKEGPPVWVESCMSEQEYREYCKKYGKTCNPPMYKVADFNKHGRWRYGMGSTPTKAEMDKTNRELESLKEFHLKKKEHEPA